MPYAAIAQLYDGTTQYITYDQTDNNRLDRDLIDTGATNVTIGSKVCYLYASSGNSMPYLSSFNLGTGCPLAIGSGALVGIPGVINTGERVNQISRGLVYDSSNITIGSGCGMVRGGNSASNSASTITILGNGYTKVHGGIWANSITVQNGVLELRIGTRYGLSQILTNNVNIPSSVKSLKFDDTSDLLSGGSGLQDIRGNGSSVGRTRTTTLGNPAFIGYHTYYDSDISSPNLSNALVIGDYAFSTSFWGGGKVQSVSFGNNTVMVGKAAFKGNSGLTRVNCNALYVFEEAFMHCSGITEATFDVSDRTNRGSFIGYDVLWAEYKYPNYPALKRVTIKGYENVGRIVHQVSQDGFSMTIIGNGYTRVGHTPTDDEKGWYVTIPQGTRSVTIGSGVTEVRLSIGGIAGNPDKGYATSIDIGEDVKIINFPYAPSAASSSDRPCTADTVTIRAINPPTVARASSLIDDGIYYFGYVGSIKVPAASLNAYKTAWPSLGDKITSI